MTISNTSSRVEYVGNGVTTQFPIPYRFLENSHIRAVYVSPVGVETAWVLGSNYTLTGADDDGGGMLTASVAPVSASHLVIYREVPATQETDYISGDPFPAESHERALDKLTMLVQQNEEKTDRALLFPVGDSAAQIGPLPSVIDRTDRLLTFNMSGVPVASDFTHTQLASLLASAYSGSAGPLDALTFLQAGTGMVPRSAQDKAREIVSIKDAGAVAGADCTAAIAICEASSHERFYVPPGLYATSAPTVTKIYYGDGNLVLNGVKQAKTVKLVQALPANNPNAGLLFGGDQTYAETTYFRMPTTVTPYYLQGADGFTDPMSNPSYRTNSYFNVELVPHFVDMQMFNGYSGMSTKVVGTAASGQKTVNVRSSATIVPGMRLLLGAMGTGTEELVTVATVPNGTSFTTVNNLAISHNANEYVGKGSRTNFNAYRADLDGNGGGDYYSFQGRISLGRDAAANPNQTHYSYNATAGLIGGDATATSSGVYLQFSEFRIEDTNYLGSHDIAAVGDVRSYGRNNDVGAFGGVWIGMLQKSEGTKYCNAAHSVVGKWLGGLDLINADFGTNQAAIKLAPNQRIYFDGSSMADEAGYNLWGANAGDTYMTYSLGGNQLQFVVDGTLLASMSSTAFFTNTARNINSGGDVSVTQGNRLMLKGSGGNTYITTDGTHVYLITNGGTPKQLD